MYLYSNNAIFFILTIEVLLTVVFIIMQKSGYYKLVKESENIGNTQDKKLKNIRNNRKNVYNVDNFVDKHVNNYEFCGLKLYTIHRICGNLLNFLFITWSMATVYGVYLECSIKDILWTVMLGIMIVGGLFSIGCGVDNYKLEEVAKVNIRDYIENIIQMNKKKEELTQVRRDKINNRRSNEIKAVVDGGDLGVVAKNIENDLLDNIDNISNMGNEVNRLNDTMKLNPIDLNKKKDNLGYLSEYMDKQNYRRNENRIQEKVNTLADEDKQDIINSLFKQYFA